MQHVREALFKLSDNYTAFEIKECLEEMNLKSGKATVSFPGLFPGTQILFYLLFVGVKSMTPLSLLTS